NADYLQAAPGNAAGNLVMILPASGLMQSAFGDIDEQGLSVDGLKIFCQNQQEVKAAAIGEVIEVVSGEKVVLRHRDGVLSYYQGAIEPGVQVGETLRQGQLLGRITESTLFFQVLRDEQPLDPFLFVKGPE
ncbi:MAG: M23 family metallopeptidase, partial [Firmicutes bacterium]|nr:M23 family metallopeptidase [Bacillota bacterium]